MIEELSLVLFIQALPISPFLPVFLSPSPWFSLDGWMAWCWVISQPDPVPFTRSVTVQRQMDWWRRWEKREIYCIAKSQCHCAEGVYVLKITHSALLSHSNVRCVIWEHFLGFTSPCLRRTQCAILGLLQKTLETVRVCVCERALTTSQAISLSACSVTPHYPR